MNLTLCKSIHMYNNLNLINIKSFVRTKLIFIKDVIKLQSIIRGIMQRNKLKKLCDSFTLEIINIMLRKYIEKINFNKEINKLLINKKIRNDNFPSEISENIAKFALCKMLNIMSCWDTKTGDLMLLTKKIEIKCFMSDGPTEFWHYIVFVDARNFYDNLFDVYLIKLSNNSDIWKNIKINKTQTYEDQCLEKRRPRLCFKNIYKQIPKKYIVYLQMKDFF